MSTITGSWYGAMTEAAESKFVKIKIFDTEKELKGKRPRTSCVETSDLLTDTKKHPTKFHETIPLMKLSYC
jgi:hypothetical protein